MVFDGLLKGLRQSQGFCFTRIWLRLGVWVDLGVQNPILKAPEALQGSQGGRNRQIGQDPKNRQKLVVSNTCF